DYYCQVWDSGSQYIF
nr:immunoglobulin light chain junction region [Macaca mulatta]